MRKRNFFYQCSVLLFWSAVMVIPSSAGRHPGTETQPAKQPGVTGVTGIIIEAVKEGTVKLDINPARMYVKGDGMVQQGSQVVLRIRGLQPHTRVYWSYLYTKGPYNEKIFLYPKPFSSCPGFTFDSRDQSSITNAKGETAVLFRASTYAGDSFQAGAGFVYKKKNESRFASAPFKSQSMETWKRFYLEQPLLLQQVRFPGSTLDLVCDNLAKLHIEVVIKDRQPLILDPRQASLSSYFTTAPGQSEQRYGPSSYLDLGLSLGDLCMQTSDGSFKTIQLLVLGAMSPRYDLIRNTAASAEGTPPPQPVDYEYNYKKKDMSPEEFMSYGSAVAQLGSCPAVVVWADYWWIFSRLVKVRHDQAMARVILHEIGHHLLRKVPPGTRGTRNTGIILDEAGHLSDTVTNQRSLMKGYCLTGIWRSSKTTFSLTAIRAEREFIKNPTWHPQVERLIRQYYIPLKQ